MKQFKSSVLKKKAFIHKNCINQLFHFLALVTDKQYNAEERKGFALKGYIASGNVYLSRPEARSEKNWFVNEGLAFLFYFDHRNRMSIHTLFGPGEMAIVPDTGKTSFNSNSYLVACKSTHLLEINPRKESKKRPQPDMACLIMQILVYQSNKYLQKDKLLRLNGIEQVAMFCTLFPQINLFGDNINIYKMFIAAFFGIEPQSLSRNLKLYKDIHMKGTLNE